MLSRDCGRVSIFGERGVLSTLRENVRESKTPRGPMCLSQVSALGRAANQVSLIALLRLSRPRVVRASRKRSVSRPS